MLKIHQPYKYKSKYILALSSIGVFLLGSLWIINYNEGKHVSAAGDSRTMADITEMQEMTRQICSNSEVGDTATLKDSRDGNTYTIIKQAKDKNCWMQQNLKLNLTKNTTIEGSKSDGTVYNWTVPSDANNKNFSATTQAYATSGTWTGNNTAIMSRVGNGNNGNYYTWCAATAGTCSGATSGGQVASASICPKGWHLPTGGGSSSSGTGEFGRLLNGVGSPAVTQPPYNFPYAGFVDSNGSLDGVGSNGYYWSRTATSDTYAYYLVFNTNGDFGPGTSGNARCLGYSVRCMATGGLEKVEKPIWQETADTGINVTVPKVLTLDVSDGVNTTADAYNVVKGEIVAIVTSNNIDYEVLLSSEQPSLIGQKDSSNYIAPVSTSNPVQPGTSAWGILNTSNLYDPITTTPTEFHNTSVKNGTSTSHTYGVGISISPALPADTYSTTVTVTASSK